MKKKINILLSVLFIVLLLALTACGNTETTSQNNVNSESSNGNNDTNATDSSDKIKVGIVTSLTGAYAPIGSEVAEAAEFAAKEINENGGVLGKQIEIITEDDEGTPDVGLRKAERLVNRENINVIMGSVSSAVGLAIGAKMPEWDSIYISTVNKTPKLTTSDFNKHIFRANHNDYQDMETIKNWYEKEAKGKSWFMIGADYEWGHSSLSEFKKIAESHGDNVLGEAYTPLGTTDYSSQITNIISQKPDGVWVALSGSDGINFISQARSYGLMEEIEVVTFITDVVVETTGKDSIDVLGNVNYHHSIDNEINNEFVERFEEKYGKKPTNYHGETYLGMLMLVNAIEQAGTTDTQEVIQSMESLMFNSILGEVTVRAEDHQLLHPNYMGKVVEKDGEVTVEITYTSSPEEANP